MKNSLFKKSALASIAVAVTLACGSAAAEMKIVSKGMGGEVNPPLAPLPPIPEVMDNKNTPEKIELGKILFFDPRVGGDASVSCASCHDPAQGWAWAEDFSRGYPGTVHWRNSQTVVNSQYMKKQFWAGGASSGMNQARSAAKGGVAGNGEDDLMEVRLALIPEYKKRFKDVFGDEWPLIRNVWRAMASFETTLISDNTPLDAYLKGDKSALSDQQKKGMKLFNGKANCIECHNGPLATDERYYNIGVPAAARWDEDGMAQITFRFEQYAKGVTEDMYRHIKDDAGFYYRSKNKWDKGKFRTPGLRYTAYTAPYMHNGAFYTLEEVIDFYNRGGVDEEGNTTSFPQNKSKLIKPLGLSDEEKEDLLAFLEAFSGDEIEIEKPKLPDYAPLFTKAELMEAKK